MVSLENIRFNQEHNPQCQYQNQRPLDIFDSPKCERLATQAIAYRHIKFDYETQGKAPQESESFPVILVEDNYPGWLKEEDLQELKPCDQDYKAEHFDRNDIIERMPDIISYAHHAMSLDNEYLWGGAVGPNLDCSGLVQCAFGSQDIWMPRDAYQQEAFTQKIHLDIDDKESIETQLLTGDLVFFGTPEKATHVAIYLGKGEYIHSSGKEQGRNGIGIDSLVELTHPVSENYRKQYRGCGRVMHSFFP